MYLQDGVWNGERILPEGFVKFVSSLAPAWEADKRHIYGGFFWLNGESSFAAPKDAYYMSGVGGQTTLIVPSHDLVVVRLGHYKQRTRWACAAQSGRDFNGRHPCTDRVRRYPMNTRGRAPSIDPAARRAPFAGGTGVSNNRNYQANLIAFSCNVPRAWSGQTCIRSTLAPRARAQWSPSKMTIGHDAPQPVTHCLRATTFNRTVSACPSSVQSGPAASQEFLCPQAFAAEFEVLVQRSRLGSPSIHRF